MVETKIKPIKYHMTCGCFLYKQHLIVRDNKLLCPHHFGTVKMRTRRCADCDEVLILSEKGGGKHRCEKHAIIYQKKVNNYLAKKSQAAKKKEAAAAVVTEKKKAAAAVVEKKKAALTEEQKMEIKKARENKLYLEKAALKKQWSKHWRGDYCRFLPACLELAKLNCDGCKEFSAIFRGVDPAKRGLFVLKEVPAAKRKTK